MTNEQKDAEVVQIVVADQGGPDLAEPKVSTVDLIKQLASMDPMPVALTIISNSNGTGRIANFQGRLLGVAKQQSSDAGKNVGKYLDRLVAFLSSDATKNLDETSKKHLASALPLLSGIDDPIKAKEALDTKRMIAVRAQADDAILFTRTAAAESLELARSCVSKNPAFKTEVNTMLKANNEYLRFIDEVIAFYEGGKKNAFPDSSDDPYLSDALCFGYFNDFLLDQGGGSINFYATTDDLAQKIYLNAVDFDLTLEMQEVRKIWDDLVKQKEPATDLDWIGLDQKIKELLLKKRSLLESLLPADVAGAAEMADIAPTIGNTSEAVKATLPETDK